MSDVEREPLVSLSVVSHGQGDLVARLLSDLSEGVDLPYEVILTLNIPEDEAFLEEYARLPLRIIHNPVAKGFGANHNAAFKQSRGRYFAVVNPDIRLKAACFQPLVEVLNWPGVGACGPAVYAANGHLEDSARRFPRPWTYVQRKIKKPRGPDYDWDTTPVDVDWLAGMFLVFRSDTYRAMGGFDDRYFLYMEDVDICRRLHSAGWRVVLQPAVGVIHGASRASRHNLRHFGWHVRSILRYFMTARGDR